MPEQDGLRIIFYMLIYCNTTCIGVFHNKLKALEAAIGYAKANPGSVDLFVTEVMILEKMNASSEQPNDRYDVSAATILSLKN